MRIGLEINKVCMSKNAFYAGQFELVISLLLVRHIIELVLFVLQQRNIINLRTEIEIIGNKFMFNKLTVLFLVNCIIVTSISEYFM